MAGSNASGYFYVRCRNGNTRRGRLSGGVIALIAQLSTFYAPRFLIVAIP